MTGLRTLFFLVAGLACVAAIADGPHVQCATCHAGPGGSGATSGTASCLDCHETYAAPPAAGGSGSAHDRFDGEVAPAGSARVMERFDCLSCHDEHGSDRPALLRAPSREPRSDVDALTTLCLDCHEQFGDDRASGGRYRVHPVGVPARAAEGASLFPVDAAGRPAERDGTVGCTTCHYVHASPNRWLLRYSDAEASRPCQSCHPGGSGNARANRASAALR